MTSTASPTRTPAISIQGLVKSFGPIEVLKHINLDIYPGEVVWSTPEAWIYLIFLTSSLGIGLYGWWRATQCAQHSISADAASGM